MPAKPCTTAEQPTTTDISRFEASFKELEAVVERLEQGTLSLEESLRDFERGVQLARECQAMLREAQQRVDILNASTGQPEPFSPDQDDL